MTPILSRRALAALVLLTMVWGLNWPLMKFALREMSPLYFRAATMSVGVLLLMAVARLRGVSLAVPSGAWKPLTLLALPNVLGWHLFSILGVQALASGRAAILGFTMPIWTILIGVFFFGEKLTRRGILSAACAAIAVALLVAHELSALTGRPVGIVWMQVAAVCWALGTFLMRRTTLKLSTEVITIWMMALSSVAFWLLALMLEPPPLQTFSGPMWWSLLWGAAINYGVAQIIWFGMARNLPPQASSFALMAVPLVGTATAGWIVDEWPRPTDWVAAAFVMVAILSALWPRAAAPGRSPVVASVKTT